jgi:hypothetical protein
LIIGLIGFKESGKSTAFNILSKVLNAKEVQLAKHLKDVCSMVFRIERSWFDDQDFKERELIYPVILTIEEVAGVLRGFNLLSETNLDIASKHVGKELNSPRKIAQFIGTDMLREFDPDIHINYAIKNAPKGSNLVVTDIRFLNELEYFSKIPDFRSVFIKRTDKVPENTPDIHPSERQMFGLMNLAETLIINDSSKEAFVMSVREYAISVKNSIENKCLLSKEKHPIKRGTYVVARNESIGLNVGEEYAVESIDLEKELITVLSENGKHTFSPCNVSVALSSMSNWNE